MNKEEVIKNILTISIEAKKKLIALNSFLNKIQAISSLEIDNDDKENMTFLYCFSTYEKFVKDVYNRVFNYLNHLKKNKIPFPEEFTYLSFLYDNLGEKKTKMRHFNDYKQKKYMEHFCESKFLKENQKLNSIKFLMNFNTMISEIEIESYFNREASFQNLKQKNYNLAETFKLFEKLYKQRNDKMHGSYQFEKKEEIKFVFDLFIIGVSVLSNSLIDILEIKCE